MYILKSIYCSFVAFYSCQLTFSDFFIVKLLSFCLSQKSFKMPFCLNYFGHIYLGGEFIEPVEKFLAQNRCSVNIWWMNESSFQETVFKILFPLLKSALWPYFLFSEGFPWVPLKIVQTREGSSHANQLFQKLNPTTWVFYSWGSPVQVASFCANSHRLPSLLSLTIWDITVYNLGEGTIICPGSGLDSPSWQ